ncbi:CE1759 family FMN reductase [Mycetocola reblochoni]|uniref:FMN reductase n=2 Tax=Mycetocola reblochoni TaxID=331618 RepID=A0A1R4KBV2_9MICO|nr:CE1759 family FMN reductase [Mycetocola reblochoni]RLP68559.1 NADH-dependent FMN reductase [Mycetocola reblochoni]SJN41796.1 FMN reductase [Mycetocola reblochoni REB411]
MTNTSTHTVAVISGGTSEPSSTRMLADRLAARTIEFAAEKGSVVHAPVVELRPLATDIATAMTSGHRSPALQRAIDTLAAADGLIVSTPIYTAGPSGLVKSFLDVLDTDLLIARPVALAATAGSARHALVVDEQLRSTFAYLRALPIPTAVFAAPEDWADSALNRRIERAAHELVTLVLSGVGTDIRERSWTRYQHAENAAGSLIGGIELDSELMRLATGGA